MYYSFDDIYTTDFIFDNQRRMMSFSFDSYFNNNQKKLVINPCSFVIRNWSSIQVDEEYNERKSNSFIVKNRFSWNVEDGITYVEDSFIMPELALIIEMKQSGQNMFIYAMSYDNKYFYIRVVDACASLDLVDMTKNINVYNSFDDIRGGNTRIFLWQEFRV